MTQVAQGALTMIGLNTPHPSVYWNGFTVPNITAVRVEWENDEQQVKLHVSRLEPIHEVMQLAGISVKPERRHE